MTWRTFGQGVLLIGIFFLAYWLLLEARDREVAAETRATNAAIMNSANANVATAEENLRRVEAGDYTTMGNDVITVDPSPPPTSRSRKERVVMDHDEDYSLANALANESGE